MLEVQLASLELLGMLANKVHPEKMEDQVQMDDQDPQDLLVKEEHLEKEALMELLELMGLMVNKDHRVHRDSLVIEDQPDSPEKEDSLETKGPEVRMDSQEPEGLQVNVVLKVDLADQDLKVLLDHEDRQDQEENRDQ